MHDPSAARHSAEDPSTNDLLDEYSLQDVQEAPTEELDISGLPIDEFVAPVVSHPSERTAEEKTAADY